MPPNDAQALVPAIAAVLAKPERLESQLDYAAQRARAQYGLAKMQELIGGLIAGLTPQPSDEAFT